MAFLAAISAVAISEEPGIQKTTSTAGGDLKQGRGAITDIIGPYPYGVAIASHTSNISQHDDGNC